MVASLRQPCANKKKCQEGSFKTRVGPSSDLGGGGGGGACLGQTNNLKIDGGPDFRSTPLNPCMDYERYIQLYEDEFLHQASTVGNHFCTTVFDIFIKIFKMAMSNDHRLIHHKHEFT